MQVFKFKYVSQLSTEFCCPSYQYPVFIVLYLPDIEIEMYLLYFFLCEILLQSTEFIHDSIKVRHVILPFFLRQGLFM